MLRPMIRFAIGLHFGNGLNELPVRPTPDGRTLPGAATRAGPPPGPDLQAGRLFHAELKTIVQWKPSAV